MLLPQTPKDIMIYTSVKLVFSDKYLLTDLNIRMDTASLNIPSPNRMEFITGYYDSLTNVNAATVS